MPFVPVPGVTQVEIVYLWDNQRVQNVLHYDLGQGLSGAIALAMGDFVKGWWDGNMQPSIASNCSLIEIALRDLSDQSASVFVYSTGLPVTGENTSPALPNNVSICLTKRTILRGRSYRGRLYHVGLCEGQVVGNNVESNYMNSLLNLYEPLLTFTYETVDYPLVVVSRQHNNVALETGTAQPVVAWTSDGQIDSQRRRLPGRGQ